ncbi:MAG: SGNH/GDSL hydrolase family protein [Gemmataceae bacterium]
MTLPPPRTPPGPTGFVTLGDSITDTYTGKPYGDDSRGWTDLLASERGQFLSLHNFAARGSTSEMLLGQGQHTSAVGVVRAGEARYVSLSVGANDMYTVPCRIDPAALIANVARAVASLTRGGAKVILGNVPDITDTPVVKVFLSGRPALSARIRTITAAVNERLRRLAGSLRVPLVDLRRLNAVSGRPFLLGGVDVSGHLYCVDGFHPSTVGSGLIANAQLEALRGGYGIDVPPLDDADILRLGGLTPLDHAAAFDAGAFVTQPAACRAARPIAG